MVIIIDMYFQKHCEHKQDRWKKEPPINQLFLHTNTELLVPFPGMLDVLRVIHLLGSQTS